MAACPFKGLLCLLRWKLDLGAQAVTEKRIGVGSALKALGMIYFTLDRGHPCPLCGLQLAEGTKRQHVGYFLI